jgi:hypothetical protein
MALVTSGLRIIIAGDSTMKAVLGDGIEQGRVTEMRMLVANPEPMRMIPKEPGADYARFLLQLGNEPGALVCIQLLADIDLDLAL